MNRGSLARRRGGRGRRLRFNEAPIHESGKCDACQRRIYPDDQLQ